MLMFLGCSENVIEPENAARKAEIGSVPQPSGGELVGSLADHHSYFPLHEGDRWVYMVTDPL
jgi:hypothetical protein